MSRIAHERLIELAESGAMPTVEEQQLFAADPAAHAELEELRMLFGDLRHVPAAALEPVAIAGILPGLRAQIEQWEAQRPSLLAWFPRPAWNAVFATLSTVLVIGMLLIDGAGPLSFNDVPAEYFAADTNGVTESLQLEASALPELDLFSGMTQSISSDTIDAYFDESTDSLMTEAASVDEDAFRQLTAHLTREGL